jgi:hypothetical protein
MSTGLRPMRSDSRPQKGTDERAAQTRVGGDDQGDIEVTAPEARGDEGQDRDDDAEADHVQQDYRKQQQTVAPG